MNKGKRHSPNGLCHILRKNCPLEYTPKSSVFCFGRGRRDRSATHPSCGSRNLLTAWSAGKFRPRRFVLLAFSHTVSARNLTRHSPRASGSTLSLVKTKDTAKSSVFCFGRGRRDRTLGTRFWRPMLYQLSYTPM